MIKNLVKNSKKKKGFTLVELIIVIAVIALISAFAIPNFMKVQNNAKIDADVNLGRSIAHEVEILITDGTITLDANGDYGPLELVTDNTDGVPATDANKDIAKKIEEDIKTGTLKLQAKGAPSKLKISVDDGKIIITDDDDVQLYPTPAGIYKK